IAWALRASARHVLDEPDDANGINLRLALGKRLHKADDTSCSRHVALHLLHASSGLERDAAGVEGDAFANKYDGIAAASAGSLPLHDRNVARPVAALPHGKQRVHAELLKRFRTEHFDLHTGLAELLSARGEFGGPEHVRRLVD